VEKEFFQSFIRDTLNVLALDPEEQIKANGPGCVACDLLNDFDTAFKDYLSQSELKISNEVQNIFQQIDDVIENMDEADYVCFENSVLYREKWDQIRNLAKECLKLLGWELVKNMKYTNVGNGVWQRDYIKP